MTYDAVGQLITSTDARGITLVHSYDSLGRATSLRSGSATGTLLAAWTYDTVSFGKGLPATSTRYVDGFAYTSAVLGYNALNLATATQLTVPSSEPGLSGTYTTYAKYDVDGSPASTTYAAAGDLPAEAVQFSYDDLGEPTTTSGGYGGATADYVTGTQYTRYGEPARTQLGDTGARVWLSTLYDDHTRRVDRTIVDTETPTPMQSDSHYTYDPSGDITSIADTPQGRPADVQCFRLDYLQRLKEAWTPAGDCAQDPSTAGLSGPAPYWQSFTYDVVGDRLTATDHTATGDTVSTSTLPASGHRLSAVTTTGPAGDSTASYSYDATGNTTLRQLPGGAQQLDWDAEGRLASVTAGPGVTRYLHDAGGAELIRRDPAGSTLYLDGQELRWTKATGALTATRYYRSGTGATVAARSAAGLVWLAGDLQGTSQIAVDSTTLRVTQHRQAPFGAPRGPAADLPGDRGFVGGAEDPSTGLTQLGARTYDPSIGRFLSVDPKIDLTDPQQMQGYAYADNSPISKMDPTGEFWGEIFGGLKKAYDFVDEHKTVIGLALTAVTLVTPVGWVAGAAMLANTALTAIDMKDQLDKRRERKSKGLSTTKQDILFGLDVLSMGLTSVSASAGGLADEAYETGYRVWSSNTKLGKEAIAAGHEAEKVGDAADRIGYVAQAGSVGYDNCYLQSGDNPELPCGQDVPPPDSNPFHYCKPGTSMCICIAPPKAAVPAQGGGRSSAGVHRPSYNLGPDKPGPDAPTWGSAKSRQLGIYQTRDGLYHRNDGKGLAFF